MKKRFICYLLTIFLSVNLSNFCMAEVISGNVNKEEFREKANVVVDGITGNPVSDAEVSIPTEGIFTKTNNYGEFKLDASLKSPVILSVKANGYQPFSLTINESKSKNPLIIVITKLFGNETIIDNEVHHLGDNKFSASSANAKDFNLKAHEPYFFKEFFVETLDSKDKAVLKIGSIIGLDTEIAKKLGQSNITISSSTPTNVYLNSQKIGEIKINGDNQEIRLPKNILRPNSYNTLKIETGINQQTTSYTDYDDMEFMNLLMVVK